MSQHNIDRCTVKGVGSEATCSLAVFTCDTDKHQCVSGENFKNHDENSRNVILWLDHRAAEETKKINATRHRVLRYAGGQMSIEMEIPKVLWLKNHMPPETFALRKFYDLADAFTYLATSKETRSLCSVTCKQGYLPIGVDGSEQGWQEDFFSQIGPAGLCENEFERLDGIHGKVIPSHAGRSSALCGCADVGQNGQYLLAGERVSGLNVRAAANLGLLEGFAVASGVIMEYSEGAFLPSK